MFVKKRKEIKFREEKMPTKEGQQQNHHHIVADIVPLHMSSGRHFFLASPEKRIEMAYERQTNRTQARTFTAISDHFYLDFGVCGFSFICLCLLLCLCSFVSYSHKFDILSSFGIGFSSFFFCSVYFFFFVRFRFIFHFAFFAEVAKRACINPISLCALTSLKSSHRSRGCVNQSYAVAKPTASLLLFEHGRHFRCFLFCFLAFFEHVPRLCFCVYPKPEYFFENLTDAVYFSFHLCLT